MRFKRSITIFTHIGILIFIVLNSIQIVGSVDKIWLEAEDAIEIFSNLRIINDERCSGGKAIKSIASSHNMNSYAKYDIDFIKSGDYFIWARTNWAQGCGNTFAIGFDEQKPFIFGNDDIYLNWHWVKCGKIRIKPGRHNFYIWNEELNAKLDKIVFTTDPSFIPSGKGEVSDFKVNFESDNYSNIIPNDSNLWSIKQKNKNSSYFLKRLDTDRIELSMVNSPSNRYCFGFNYKIGENYSDNSICFAYNYVDKSNFSIIKLIDSSLIVQSVTDDAIQTLKTIQLNRLILNTNYNKFSIIKTNKTLIIKINNRTIGNIKDYNSDYNVIGFGSDKGNVYFDDVEYNTDLIPVGFRTWEWEKRKGDWDRKRTMQFLKSSKNDYALLSTGKEYWSNYSLTAAVIASANTGICFNVQDSSNFYLYKIGQDENNATFLSLIKVMDGKSIELNTCYLDLLIGEWYKFEVSKCNDSIIALIDDSKIMECVDSTYNYGFIGLWSSDTISYSIFDDVKVVSNNAKIDTSNSIIKYTFVSLQNASYNFCDWINSSKYFKKCSNNRTFFKKNLFEETMLINKKLFSGKIKFELNQEPVPRDVDINFYLWGTNNIKYLVVVKKNMIFLFKDDVLVKKQKITSDRDCLIFEYTENNKFKISNENNELFLFKEMDLLDSYQVGLSYSGIGCFTTNLFLIDIDVDNFSTKPIRYYSD